MTINQRKFSITFIILTSLTAIFSSCTNLDPRFEEYEGYTLVQQVGPTLGYSPESGMELLYEGMLVFKDLNKNGMLDPYEDWRLKPQERAANLASLMRDYEIAGLMLYSSHQAIKSAELTKEQKDFFLKDSTFIRHILVTSVESPEIAAKWNNNVQALAEKMRLGIPTNNSSDPRHSAENDVEFRAGGGGKISMWPNELGMGATFDTDLMRTFGLIASKEYRALGFTTCLSPQIDIATDPRWMRFNGTYGEDPELVKDMAVAYCDAFQTTVWNNDKYGTWGRSSVNVMVKHWPGGGPGEAGRDAHFGRGKYAVYPNNNLELQKYPFVEGAFKLQLGTEKAAAVMPYYTIPVGQTKIDVANNFNKEMIADQLRKDQDYDGVICTDWKVTGNEYHPGMDGGKPWGVEEFSVAERHYMALLAGVDQFGGCDDPRPVLEAFAMIKNLYGNGVLLDRIRKSAERLLVNMFRIGLFENPYLDPKRTAQIVGNPEYMKAGYEAQLKSIVMLKNKKQTLPLADSEKCKVYIPQRHIPRHTNFFWGYVEEETFVPVSTTLSQKYFQQVETPEEADAAIIFIESPQTGWGYKASETLSDPVLKDKVLREKYGAEYSGNVKDYPTESLVFEDDIYFQPAGGKIPEPKNGYYPISLQYSDYVAVDARAKSLAGGDPFEKGENRSYKGKGVRCINKEDMLLVQNTRKQMPGKKIIVVIECKNPMVMKEIEPYADAVLLTFSVQNQAVLDIVTGKAEPYALLPFQMPKNMKTVELQAEDTPHDMECYVDSEGNTYDFAYGLNWGGVINDERVEKYKK